MLAARAVLVALLASLAACAAPDEEPAADDGSEVKVDTRSPEARRQYDANVRFVTSYQPRCAPSGADRPRVLLTGFGRFMTIVNNATGRMVSSLVPSAAYPMTPPPAPGEVDEPGPQLSVGTTTIDFPGVGPVDVCGMILPVYWDLAAILIAREMDAFKPSFLMMNGVAGTRQQLWLELGAMNLAVGSADGSNVLRPAVGGDPYTKLIESAPHAEDARGNLLSWSATLDTARATIRAHAADVDQGTAFDAIMPDALLAGFPRASNTYLCNNVTYTTGWLMDHPGKEVKLLRASKKVRGSINEVPVKLDGDFRAVPRVFVHWPSSLAHQHVTTGAEVMKSIVGAQLAALARGEAPTRGDNTLASPSLPTGDFY